MSDEAVLDFCKVDSNLDSNPKIRKAGFFGAAVFQFILRVNRRLRREGDVPLSFVDAEYIADEMRIPGDDAPAVAHRAVAACVNAKLLELDHEAGIAVIVGWADEWGMRPPRSGRERTRAWRDKKLLASVTGDEDRHGDVIRSEETRGEERRDQTLSPDSDVSPELPDPPAIVGADHGPRPEPPPGIPNPGAGRSERVKINHDAWRYAAMKHAQLGLDGSATWPVMPAGEPANDLVKRTVEVLAMHDPPRFAEARALITRRIDVAFAEAQRENHARWFTPSRMWDAKSFWRAVEQTPEQAATPRSPPRGSPANPEPRKIKTLG